MGIQLNIRGIEVTVSSPGEAAMLIRELTDGPSPKIGRPKTVESSDPHHSAIPENQLAIDFLTAIVNAGKSGVTQKDMVGILKVEHPKGIGGRSVRINNIFVRRGFRPEEIYANTKTPRGRIWKAKHRIQEALKNIVERPQGV